MAQVGRELMAAARTRSPGVMASVIQRYGDVSYIGLFSLGTYRSQLPADGAAPATTPAWCASSAATPPPKRRSIRWPRSSGPTRACAAPAASWWTARVTLADGSSYDVRWLLRSYGSTYKVRDAMVLGFWMTPFLKKLFEDYIAQNGGNPRALVAALNR